MTRIVTLLLLISLVIYVSSDYIQPAAFQRIFPYADPAYVKGLASNVNMFTQIEKKKRTITNWMKHWKDKKATVDAKNPLSKKAYAQEKALTFIDHRFALKKYINYLCNQSVKTKYLTEAEAKNMRTLFRITDTQAVNNYTLARENFTIWTMQKIQKTPTIQDNVNDLTEKFAKTNPTDYANLQWTL